MRSRSVHWRVRKSPSTAQLSATRPNTAPRSRCKTPTRNIGNATNGDPRIANGGSEIDRVFAKVAENRLYVLVAGNLESNFNKLEVFIDSVPGGDESARGGEFAGAR